ncbi:hypothetical protein AGR8A_pTi20164 [Agrobacterium fabrum str. J-07]|nr:hypothetical protein AGR8A_pTi20164 [Agrobacterium fabrum str. J-07]
MTSFYYDGLGKARSKGVVGLLRCSPVKRSSTSLRSGSAAFLEPGICNARLCERGRVSKSIYSCIYVTQIFLKYASTYQKH